MGTNTDLYRSARDQLVALISDRDISGYDRAVDAFVEQDAHRVGTPIDSEYRYEDLMI